jgi:hypothetical protein
MDYTEFRETMRAKYAQAEERQERRAQRRRLWTYISLVLLAAVVLALIVFRLTR